MNLFVLDEDPALAAQGLDDKRLGKLLMEANMMMSVAVGDHSDTAETGAGMLSRRSHVNHPVTLWVGLTRSNFIWCAHHAFALSAEWRRRYGRTHGSSERTPYIWSFRNCIPDGPLLTFQNSARHQGLGLDYSHLPPVEGYRAYIQKRWETDKLYPRFTNREWPQWAQEFLNCA